MADDYDELFRRLEDNVERMQSDDLGMAARLALCRESRDLVKRCTDHLQRLGTDIEELSLEDLLAEVEAIGSERAARPRKVVEPVAHAAPEPAAEEVVEPDADVPAPADEVATPEEKAVPEPEPETVAEVVLPDFLKPRVKEPAEPLPETWVPLLDLVERHLKLVAQTLLSLKLPLTLATLADFGRPPALGALLARMSTQPDPEALEHVSLLQANDAALEQALRRLGALRRDPDVTEWLMRGIDEGHDVLAELAEELVLTTR